VVKSLEASLWAFHDADTFVEAVLKAVNLGNDADTTGAICGQLAGAYRGESGISGPLTAGLARMEIQETPWRALRATDRDGREAMIPKNRDAQTFLPFSCFRRLVLS
jgi:ADP-ribosylglycohydrolase